VEPLTVLTAIAAVTAAIRLTTEILIVPLRPAVLLAKWAATIDSVSGGRLELGVGTGWQEEEFAAMGLDHRLRGQMLTDGIGACRALWGPSSPSSYRSSTVSFSEIWCEPKPTRAGGPPVLFSGTLTPRNLRRIVELGDGWIPIMGERRAGIADGVVQLRELYAGAGRARSNRRRRPDEHVCRIRGRHRRVLRGGGAGDRVERLGKPDARRAVIPAGDHSALRQVVDAYADAVDRRDRVGLLALFTPDAEVRVQVEDGPVESSWRGAAVADMLEVLAPFPRTFHHVGGAVFEPGSGPDEATGRTHCLAHHYDRSRNGPTDLVMMIRYHDRYVRGADGAWLIADRQVIIDWTELHAAHPVRRGRTAGKASDRE
jgi:alkanesulfonate monooxygenase SsuD/methylene tetrahydromethanopterin reductase-like flavin-dependent oxidoreductase (luciferase family)